MELRHLRYFTAVAETCHFSRASERLHIAQPALSQAIRRLEGELGTPLLERTTRQVSLTAAGEYFLAEARRVLDAVDAGVRGVRRIAAGRLGLVRLGLGGTAVRSHLPGIARTVRTELPGIELEVRADLLNPAQHEAVLDGSLDLGLVRAPDHRVPEGIELRPLDTEPLVLALPPDHPLTTEPLVPLTRLREEDLVMYASAGSAVDEAVRRACRDAGFVPRPAQEVDSTAVLLAMVSAGLGPAIVPAGACALAPDGVAFTDLLDAGTVGLALSCRSDETDPAVLAVVAAVEAGLPTRGPDRELM